MVKEVPYYTLDGEGPANAAASGGEAYIDDDDMRDLLIDLLGEDISEEDIQKILNAASDENLSEEDFDKLVDEFILNSKH